MGILGITTFRDVRPSGRDAHPLATAGRASLTFLAILSESMTEPTWRC